MYDVSDEFKKSVVENARRIYAYIKLDDNTEYELKTCSFDDNSYSTDTDSFIGTFIAKSGTIKFNVEDNVEDNIELENKSFNLYFGIQLENEEIEYVPMGHMNVYEKISDTEYKFMDDKMFFNVDFDISAITYPTTPLKVIKAVCNQVGIPLLNDDFPNSNLEINEEIDFGESVKCTDIVIAVAQASCNFAHIARSNELELRWFKKVEFECSIDNQYSFPTTEVEYGPINSLVLSREPQEDNIYISDEESIEVNGLTELKISDNPFLDYNREVSKTEVWDRINGFSYTPFTASVQGQFHLDAGDIISIQLKDESYIDVPILNHTLEYSGGIKSTLTAIALTKNQIDYSAAATDEEKAIKQTSLKVDKQGQLIDGIIENQEEQENTISEFKVGLDGINTLVQNTRTEVNKVTEQISQINQLLDSIEMRVQKVANKTEYMSGESIEEYSVTSAPNLKAYPTTLFYTYDVCSTALKCSDKLICGYNDFKRHEGELAKDTVNNLFYVFEKNTDTDEYEWREIDSNEYLELLPAYSMIRITKDFVEIYAMLNNKLGCINISPDGVKASKLYCC